MNRTCIRTCFVTILVAAAQALGTDRYFGNLVAVSSSGKFRIEAKSQDNAGGTPTAFASGFIYALTDTTTGKMRWTRQQPMARSKGEPWARSTEWSPTALFVDDDGFVIASQAGYSVLILDPRDGHKLGEVELLKAFPKSEQNDFVSRTTGGDFWTQFSDWYFATVTGPAGQPAKRYFVVRPYWNHRLVIELSTMKLLDLDKYHSAASAKELEGAPDEVRRVLEECIRSETDRALAAMKLGTDRVSKDADHALYREVITAVHSVGFLGLTQAEPDLRRFEQFLATEPEGLQDLRVRVRETLRRLGKVPAPGFGRRLYEVRTLPSGDTYEDGKSPFNATVPVNERTASAEKIVPGMTLARMCELLGCPDEEVYDNGRCYDYDIDENPPFTLRVMKTDDHKSVARLRKIIPPAFVNDRARRRQQ